MSPSEFVLPTGTVEIVIDLRGGILRVSDSSLPLQFESFHGAVVCGPHSEPFVIGTSQPADLLGVHFASGGAFPFLGVPLDELRNHRVSLRDLWGKAGDSFLERIPAATSRSESAQAVQHALLDRMSSGSTLHPAVASALKALQGGLGKIGPIKREIGLSSRHFERVFRDQVGLAPKRFSRVRRFQALLSSIDGAQSVDWAALALRFGFSDQAHLVHDFREFAGVTPSAYLSKQTDHRNHIPCDW